MPAPSEGGLRRRLRGVWLGRVDYGRALEWQERARAANREIGDVLLLLEHEPVYTTGRLGAPEHLPPPGEASGVPVYRVSRGGDATYHGPGQLVGYPIVDLRARGRDAHGLLRALERALIATLRELGVAASTWAGRTGVWVPGTPPRKIASIGIGVRRGVSCHGFALNVAVDLRAFGAIVPCGLRGVEMTSVERERGVPTPPLERVAARAAVQVADALGAAPSFGETPGDVASALRLP